jgi:hypothetical protein
MNKRIIFLSIIIGVLCLGTVSYAGINAGFFGRDRIIENDPDVTKKVTTQISDTKIAGDLVLSNSTEIADDGSLIYEVKNSSNGKFIGSFSYMPWLEKRPIYNILNNGDVILGKEKIFSSKENKILPLTQGIDIGVFDYDVNENNIAIIGKSNPDTAEISIVLKSIADGKYKTIDAFKYSANNYPEVVYLGWGNGNKLYYDYFENNVPCIKVYDPETSTSKIFLENALNPQISPDGEKMVFEMIDSLNKSKQTISELQLFDLKSNSTITKLDGSRKIFWDTNYLIVKNVDDANLIIYDLDNGSKIKEYAFDDQPYEVKIENNGLKVKSFHFKDSTITENESTIMN